MQCTAYGKSTIWHGCRYLRLVHRRSLASVALPRWAEMSARCLKAPHRQALTQRLPLPLDCGQAGSALVLDLLPLAQLPVLPAELERLIKCGALSATAAAMAAARLRRWRHADLPMALMLTLEGSQLQCQRLLSAPARMNPRLTPDTVFICCTPSKRSLMHLFQFLRRQEKHTSIECGST